MRDRLVVVGQQLARGEQLGTVGTTGRSTGPHLHFGLIVNGTKADPSPYLGLPSGEPCA